MSNSLKNQTVNGIFWSGADRFLMQGLQFILSFVIARKLYPSDYGLIAMLNIFMALAQTFIDSGFSNALIQKQNRTNIDYSTVFYFNIAVSFLLYGCFYLSAPYIATFYNQPLLKDVIVWIGLNLIISAFSTVQRAKLTIELNFKLQTIISLISFFISAPIAIWMAYKDYGVWTLVVAGLLGNIISVILLWLLSHWTPLWAFSMKSFKSLFGFGSKLLGGSLIHTLYVNLYSLVIGKFFNSADLGFYNRAFSITQYPSSNITSVLVRVIYPIECKMQDDNELLQEKFYLFIRMTAFVVFPAMVGLIVVAEPLVSLILTDKWLGCVPYIQILSLAFMWDPIQRMNVDLLNVKHRSDYTLKAEVLKKILGFAILFASIPFGIKVMCFGFLATAFMDMLVVSHFVTKLLPRISFFKEMKSLSTILLQSVIMAVAVYGLRLILPVSWLSLGGCIVLGLLIYILLSLLFSRKEIGILYSLFLSKNQFFSQKFLFIINRVSKFRA